MNFTELDYNLRIPVNNNTKVSKSQFERHTGRTCTINIKITISNNITVNINGTILCIYINTAAKFVAGGLLIIIDPYNKKKLN